MFPYSMTISKFFGKTSSFTFYWCKSNGNTGNMSSQDLTLT